MVVRPHFYESIGVSIIFGGERMQQILFLTNMEQTATRVDEGYGKAAAAGGGCNFPLDGHRT